MSTRASALAEDDTVPAGAGVAQSAVRHPGHRLRAEARLSVVARAGRSVIDAMASQPPLTLRPVVPVGADGVARAHLVGSAAGPLGGDDLALAIEVGADAALELGQVAATMVLPGVAGAWSTTTVAVSVGAGGSAVLANEPMIAVEGCRHRAMTAIELAADASLWWSETLVLGRHDQAPGSILQRLRIDRDGRPLHRNDLAIGPAFPEWAGPAVLGGTKAVTTVVRVAGTRPVPSMPAWLDAATSAHVKIDQGVTIGWRLHR